MALGTLGVQHADAVLAQNGDEGGAAGKTAAAMERRAERDSKQTGRHKEVCLTEPEASSPKREAFAAGRPTPATAGLSLPTSSTPQWTTSYDTVSALFDVGRDVDQPIAAHAVHVRVRPGQHPRPRLCCMEPLHLLVDSTGLKLCGAGEWLIEKHGAKTRRSWRKLHIGLDADTGQIVAAALTAREVDDGAEVGPLLDQISGSVASFTADGAYDQDGVSTAMAKCHPEAAIIVPPRSTAVPSETAETAPTQRDRHVQSIAEHGRAA